MISLENKKARSLDFDEVVNAFFLLSLKNNKYLFHVFVHNIERISNLTIKKPGDIPYLISSAFMPSSLTLVLIFSYEVVNAPANIEGIHDDLVINKLFHWLSYRRFDKI